MPVTIRTQEPLRKLMDNEPAVQISARSIAEALNVLQRRYPCLAQRLIERDGSIRRFINIYVNEEDIRFLQNQETALQDGDEIRIIPSIAGG